MSALQVASRPLELVVADDGLAALPFIDPLGDHLTIAARCGDCGWIGEQRLYTSGARWCVAIACSLHTCMSPKAGLLPTVLLR